MTRPIAARIPAARVLFARSMRYKWRFTRLSVRERSLWGLTAECSVAVS